MNSHRDLRPLSETLSVASSIERHYTPSELGGMLQLSARTVQRLFYDEPGVVKVGIRLGRKREHFTLRIPESVAQRVLRRMSAGR